MSPNILSRTLRGSAVVATSTALLVAGSTSAWAHDCFNASRSDTGNTAAGTHSQAWFQGFIADFIAEDVANNAYTAEQGACLLGYWSTHGGPASVTFHIKGANGSDGLIGLNNPNTELYSNGTGIDHFEDAYGDLIEAAFGTCLG